jgi:hypothetical protein
MISRGTVAVILVQVFKTTWAKLQKQRMPETTKNALRESPTVGTLGSFHIVSGYGWKTHNIETHAELRFHTLETVALLSYLQFHLRITSSSPKILTLFEKTAVPSASHTCIKNGQRLSTFVSQSTLTMRRFLSPRPLWDFPLDVTCKKNKMAV